VAVITCRPMTCTVRQILGLLGCPNHNKRRIKRTVSLVLTLRNHLRDLRFLESHRLAVGSVQMACAWFQRLSLTNTVKTSIPEKVGSFLTRQMTVVNS
jgi:hypothetical protein